MIHLRNVGKRFGSITALEGVTFTIRPGEVLGLLGHNGAGKTTTLRLITTLLEPTTGFIERPPDFKPRLGYFADEPFLFDYLTGRELLYFMGSLYRIPAGMIQDRSTEYLRLFELSRNADHLLVTYSRGMRRKISLVASLLNDPFYWLLDEPTEALDPVAIRKLKEIIAGRRRDGRAVVLSTHLLTLAEEVCDRLIVLDHGKIVFDGAYRPGTSSLEDLYLKLVTAS